MNFQQFAAKEFDHKQWINEAFAARDAQHSGQSVEKFAQSLVTKLSVCIEEINRELEETSKQVINTIPRVIADVESIEQESRLLQENMVHLLGDVTQVESSTLSAMDDLVTLDGNKQHLLRAQNILKESSAWHELKADVDAVFATGDATLMYERIVQLDNCRLVIGELAPDHAARSEYVNALIDQFAAALSPSVVQAINGHNTQDVMFFSRMLCRLHRSSTLDQYYNMCVKNQLEARWKATLTTVGEQGDAVELMTAWHDELSKLYANEMQWLCEVAVETKSTTAAESADDLLHEGEEGHEGKAKNDATVVWPADVSSCVNSFTYALRVRTQQTLLQEQLAARLTNSQRVLHVLNVMAKMCDHLCVGLHDTAIGHQQKLASKNGDGDDLTFLAVVDALHDLYGQVYAPLIPFAHAYTQYAQSELLAVVNAQPLDSPKLAENVQEIDRSVDVVFDAAKDIVTNGQQFMGVASLPSVVKAIKTALVNYMSRVRKLVNKHYAELMKPYGTDDATVTQGVEVDADWPAVDALLRLVKAAGKLSTRMADLDAQLVPQTIQMRSVIERHTHHVTDGGQGGNQLRRRHTTSTSDSLSSFERVLLTDATISLQTNGFIANSERSDADYAILGGDMHTCVTKVLTRCVRCCAETMLAPAVCILQPMPKWSEIWASQTVGESLSAQLPSFATTPQEYVTKLGHYIMTLAHHVAPYAQGDDQYMRAALVIAPPQYYDNSSSVDSMAHIWLSTTVYAICARYVELALRIRHMSPAGATQLAHDMQYICACMEDVGIAPPDDLLSMRALMQMDKSQLKAAQPTFKNGADVAVHISASMVSAVRDMRKPTPEKK